MIWSLVLLLFFIQLPMFPNEASADFSPAAGVQVKGIRGANGIYYGKISVEFSNGIEYSRDQGQSWQAYNTPVQFAPSKGYSVLYRTIGSSEYNTLNLTVKLDSIAPLTTAEMVSASNSDGYYKGSAQVKLSAIDQQSGVKTIQYSTDLGMNWVTYSSPVTLTEEQASQFYYRSIDYSGNIEKNRILTVLIDSTPPDVPTVRIDPMYWTTQNATVSIIDGTDENSGTAKTEYSIGESGQWITYENPFVVSTENETIYARSVDGAGNVSPIIETFVPIDRTAPQSAKVEMDEEWSWLSVLVSINTEQDQNERNRIRYQFKMGDSLEWETYVDELYIKKVGETPISFRSFDEAENYSPIVTKVARFDDIPPTAPTTFKVDNLRYNQFDLSWSGATDNIGIKGYDIYTEDDQFVATVDRDHYQITGLKANTTYRYKLVTYDLAYNESDYSEVFEVTTHSRPDFKSTDNSLIALRGDGTVWTWGTNAEGSLGTGNSYARSIPKPIANLNNVKSIYTGSGFVIAQKVDGTVVGWGGFPVNSTMPKEIKILKEAKKFFIKNKRVFIIQKDDSLWAWGQDPFFESADKAFETPESINLKDVKDLKFAAKSVVVLTNSKDLWTWGKSSIANSSRPARHPIYIDGKGDNVSSISSGGEFAIALLSTKTLNTWGYDRSGELGNNPNNNFFEPKPLYEMGDTSVQRMYSEGSLAYYILENIDRAYAADNYGFAINELGELWGWGNNDQGQLGNSLNKNFYLAEKLKIDNVLELFTPGYGIPNYVLALKKDHTLWGWGDSKNLTGNTQPSKNSPPKMLLDNVDMINYQYNSITAVKSDETFWMMGQDFWSGVEYSRYESAQKVNFGESISSGQPAIEIPSTPDKLNLLEATMDTIKLNWASSLSKKDIKYYNIYVDDQRVGVSSTNEYTITQLKPNQNYKITIMAEDMRGFVSEVSEPLLVTTVEDKPSKVTNLSVSSKSLHSVQFTWGNSKSASEILEYRIFMDDKQIATTTNTMYMVKNLKSGSTYSFKIQALNKKQSLSEPSELLKVTLNEDIPTMPSGLTSNKQTSSSIQLNWLPSQSESIINKYVIFVNNIEIGTSKKEEYLIEGLKALTAYKITVKAVSEEGYSSSFSVPLETMTKTDEIIAIPTELKISGIEGTKGYLKWDVIGDDTKIKGYNVYLNNILYKSVKEKNVIIENLNYFKNFEVYVKSVNMPGYESEPSKTIAFKLATLNNISIIEAGNGNHMSLLKPNGSVWMWGSNNYKQISNTSVSSYKVPVLININDAQLTRQDSMYSYIIKTDGSLWFAGNNKAMGKSWYIINVVDLVLPNEGTNNYALKGDGTVSRLSRTNPDQVSAKVIDSVIGLSANKDQVLALKKDGTVWDISNDQPKIVYGISDVKEIDSNYDGNFALKKDGTVWSWKNSYNPTQVPGLDEIQSISAAASSAAALTKDGRVFAWGSNNTGQFGNGLISNTKSSVPLWIYRITDVKQISVGNGYMAAIKSDGTVWTWGRNTEGQLGDGTLVNQLVPTKINF